MNTAAALAAAALASVALAGPPPSGLVVLDQSSSSALSMNGSSSVEIPARAVFVNSSHANAVTTTGTAVLDAPFLYIVGGARFGGQSHCTGQVVQSVAPYVDPCSGIHPPSTAGMVDHGAGSYNGNVSISPGYYSGGIRISGSAAVTFEPGVYVIGGTGLSITSGTMIGEGVSLVIASGELKIRSNAPINLSPPTDGSFKNIVIFQPPTNTTAVSIAGGSEVNISGTIYTPRATLELFGSSSVVGEGPQMGDVVVANKVDLRGTGSIKIGREGAPAIALPVMAVYD